MARATTGFEQLRSFFQLGVNFGPALVNVHRIELFVLDGRGHIDRAFTRLQWDPAEVADHARSLR
jgi:cytochrome oxidase Cu insertion factor (SCO1/SenC/PrrC family)